MKQLSETWFVEPLFDYEYKTYEVMAYAQSMESRFSERKLFPYLDDVKRLLHNLDAYRAAKEDISENLRTELLEVDFNRLKMIREALPDSSGVMAELDGIVRFASHTLGNLYREGSAILDELLNAVEITPLGILGAAENPGWLLFRKPRSVRIYSYHFRLVRRPFGNDSYKDVCTKYHSEITAGRFENLNAVKWELMNSSEVVTRAAPNAFLIETGLKLPQCETLMPIAKHFLIRSAA